MEILIAWAALAIIIILFGLLIDNENLMGFGAVMLLMTCAFKV